MLFFCMTRFWSVAVVSATTLLFCADAFAGKRVAFVIGNSAYEHAGVLANPHNDAADMANVLRTRGFEVIEGLDLDKASFDRKTRDFAAVLTNAEFGTFFYAGHGLQVAGLNYLMPIDAKLGSAAALDFEMISLDLVQRTMEREAPTNVLFLDACRDNPLARNLARGMGTRSAEIGRGLAQSGAGIGTLISFSTQPGNVALDGSGRNSPFAAALVRQITTSTDDLSGLLIAVRNDVIRDTNGRQVPWDHGALTGRIYFSANQTPSPRPSSAADKACFGKLPDRQPTKVTFDDGSVMTVLERTADTLRYRTASGTTAPMELTSQGGAFTLSSIRDGKIRTFEWQDKLENVAHLSPGQTLSRRATIKSPDAADQSFDTRITVMSDEKMTIGSCTFSVLKIEMQNTINGSQVTVVRYYNPDSQLTLRTIITSDPPGGGQPKRQEFIATKVE